MATTRPNTFSRISWRDVYKSGLLTRESPQGLETKQNKYVLKLQNSEWCFLFSVMKRYASVTMWRVRLYHAVKYLFALGKVACIGKNWVELSCACVVCKDTLPKTAATLLTANYLCHISKERRHTSSNTFVAHALYVRHELLLCLCVISMERWHEVTLLVRCDTFQFVHLAWRNHDVTSPWRHNRNRKFGVIVRRKLEVYGDCVGRDKPDD